MVKVIMNKLVNSLVLILLLTAVVFCQRDEWCESDDHDHDEGELPHAEDFLREIFGLYGDNSTCTITHHDFEHLLEDLGIGSGIHAPHDEHSEDEHSHRRRKRAVDHTCYDAHDLLEIFNVSEELGINQEQFTEMSPAFIQQIVQGCHHHEEHSDPTLSAGKIWGYTLIAVTIVSACAPLGLIIAKFRHTSPYKFILTIMLGLAVGTLLADSLMHLIPHSIGIHGGDDHDHDHGNGVESFVWKTFLSSLTILAFLNLQMLIHHFHAGGHSHSHSFSVNSVSPQVDEEKDAESYKKSSLTPIENGSALGVVEKVAESNDGPEAVERSPESLGWMIAIGDSFHNFADGLALGAAFSDSWQTGVGTTIAIFCHELPHEFGDVAAQLSVGWSAKRILLVQIVSQSSAYLGMCIGIPISENTTAKDWILVMTAGMFLYLALVDIIPELMQTFAKYRSWSLYAAMNVGIFIGFLIMLIISILEGVLHY